MFGLGDLKAVGEIGVKLVDELFDTEEEKAAAKAKLIGMEQDGRLKELDLSLSAILAEAKSKDKWTSRARPMFLYVMYYLIIHGFRSMASTRLCGCAILRQKTDDGGATLDGFDSGKS